MAYKQLTQAEVATIDRLQKKGTTPGGSVKKRCADLAVRTAALVQARQLFMIS